MPDLQSIARHLREWLHCGPKPHDCRNRDLPPSATLSAWLLQALGRNLSCLGTMALLASHFRLKRVPTTGGYCQARARLSETQIDEAHRFLAARFAPSRVPSLLGGLPRKALDGVAFTVTDTPENRDAFPLPAGREPGCGLPALACMAVRVLATGRMISVSCTPRSASGDSGTKTCGP